MAILQVPYSIDLDKLGCVFPETRDGETGGVLKGIFISGESEHIGRRALFITGDYRRLSGIISEGFKSAGKEVVEAESGVVKGYNVVVPSDNISGLVEIGHPSKPGAAIMLRGDLSRVVMTTASVDEILNQVESPQRRAAITVMRKSPELAATRA